jgi:hypothetical protein
MAARRLSRRQKHILHWLAADYRCTRGMIRSSHQDLVRALPGDKGNISHSLQTLEARGPHCHQSFARRESRSPVAHAGGTELGLPAYRKL